MKILITRKVGMTRLFDEAGVVRAGTVLKADDNIVTQLKGEKEDYAAVQVGAGKKKHVTKPMQGHFKASKANSAKVREFLGSLDKKPGDSLTVTQFSEGDVVTVQSISKGKGYQGVIKRHGWSRGPETHGSDHHRKPGSVGSMFPQRTQKGRKLPGRMGGEQVTIKNLKVLKVLEKDSALIVSGAIPGPNKTFVKVWA